MTTTAIETIHQFIVETAEAFYDDNNNQDLTNEQLCIIAEMTNEKFGTNYTDDDIFDFLEEFEQELIEAQCSDTVVVAVICC